MSRIYKISAIERLIAKLQHAENTGDTRLVKEALAIAECLRDSL